MAYDFSEFQRTIRYGNLKTIVNIEYCLFVNLHIEVEMCVINAST